MYHNESGSFTNRSPMREHIQVLLLLQIMTFYTRINIPVLLISPFYKLSSIQ